MQSEGHKLNLHWKDGALEKMCLYGGCEESVTIRYRSEFEYREKNGHVRKSEACEDGWRLNIEVKEQEEYCFYGKTESGNNYGIWSYNCIWSCGLADCAKQVGGKSRYRTGWEL